ncbi:MAG: amino acid adenylation domain-containing protein [Gammaproteobacteria bacterium]|nr:MAG: amino acid adenylation domain-containing protein [Gammaproteobacteria bacterium]
MNSSLKSGALSHNPFAFGELAAAVDSTESQREVWLASQFGDDANCAFNESVFIHLKGKLNEKALEAALVDLALRHESIRGCFSSDGHQMVFYKDRTIPLKRYDYQAQTEAEAQSRLKSLCSDLVEQPFDLFNGPLARFDLIKFAPEQYSLVLTFHHSVCDGWSLYVIADELGHLYTARLDNSVADLEPAPSFAEYAVWERSEETAQLRADSLKYWQDQYKKGAPSLELPYDNARPAQRSFAALRMDKEIPIDVIGHLKKLAATNKSTLISTLMAGFVAYLYRLSGSQEIVLGVPFAGQMAKGDHALVGHCVNIIPLYFKLEGKESFRDLIAMTQQKMLDAFEYQYLTYGTLLQTIEAERDPSKPPLVSVIFNVDQEGEPSEAYRDLAMEFGSNPRTFENFDINMNITLSAKSAVMECTYNTSLWRKSSMERRLTELEVFYARLHSQVDQSLSNVEFILDADREAIVNRWGDTRRDYKHAGSLHGLIEAAVDKFPNNIAVIAESEQLTYAELDAQANRLAHYLIAQGVGAETMVPLMMERSLEMVIAINAVLKAGGAYLPLDPEHPLDRVEYILAEAGAKLVLIQERFDGNLPNKTPRLAVDMAEETLAAYPVTRPNLNIKPDQLAYVIYTSGSTGKPKGVMNEHQAVCNHMLWMDEVYQLKTSDKILQKTPYTFDVSLWELFLPLISGSQLIMAKPGGHKETGYLIELINQYQMTYVHFVPSMLYLFLQEADHQKCPSIVRVLASGEAVSKDLEQRFVKAFPDVELWNLYGPTEAAIHVTYWLCGQGDSGASVPIGYPLTNTRLYVVDNALKLQPPGVPGELLLAGVQIARGYVNRPDLTADRFIADPYVQDPLLHKPGRVYRTGDLVRMRDDGVVEYIGRNDFQVKLRGQRIELGEIEAVISQYPGVTQSVVLAREDRKNDQRLVAYLMTQNGTAPETQAMRDHLRAALPDYMVPSHFVVLAKFPLTSSGKVDRKALPAPVLGEVDESSFALPSNSIEEQLVAIWKEILGLEKVGVTNDFFELGGHSLLGTQMFARVKSLFSINIGLRKLFEAPTIRQLAEIIAHETSSGNVQAKMLPRAAGETPIASTQQQRVWYLEQIEPDSFAYNLPAPFRLRGKLNHDALQRAFETIEQRHELLRAGFRTEGGKLVLKLRDSLGLDLKPIPVSDFGVDNLDDLKQVLRKDAAKPFDTERGPLFTVRLIELAPDDYVIFLLMHHLVFDGWSFDILLKEMCTLYNAYAQNLPNPLSPLPVQYADYAIWQKSWLESDAVKKQLSYWSQQLSGELPVLDLPLDKVRPAHQAHRAEGINFHFDEPLLQELEELGSRHGATLFMVIIGLYALTLHRYSRQDDILVSVPVSARNQMEISGLMGPFINRLVCRFRFKPQRTFASFLQDVKKTVLEAMDNQDTQFETLVHTLNPPRDAARPPLVQTLFSYQDVRNRGDQMDGIQRSQVDIERMGVQTDLDVWVKRQLKGMDGGMEFPIELFNKATVQAIGTSFVEAASLVAKTPDLTLGELVAAGANEQETLKQWNNTAIDFAFNQGVVSDWIATAAGHAEKNAVTAGANSYTYGQLEQRSNRIAHYLQAKGLKAGDLAGVLVKRTCDLPALIIAIWKLGAAYVPLDPSYPSARVNTILSAAAVKLVISDSDLINNLGDFAEAAVRVDLAENDIAHSSDKLPQLLITPEQLAYVIFTSGSTGVPKGVEVTQGALHNFIHAVKREPGIGSHDRLLALTTLAFDISLLELFLPLTSGASVVLASEEQSQDDIALRHLLDEHQITLLQATPATWRLLLNAGWKVPSGFRGFCGGELLTTDLAADLLAQGIDLWNLYGPTEATVWTSAYRVRPAGDDGATEIYIGHPLANTQLHVLDDAGRTLPIGVFGELWIGGAGLARGYLGDPDQTAARFVVNAQGERLYRTGDRARWTRSGNIEFSGRLDSQIKLRGFRIELEEIEIQLRRHAAIKDVAVVLQYFDKTDQRLVAYVVYQDDEEPTNTELRKHLRQYLPDYMLPQQFTAITQLPLLPSGKVNRKSLSAPVVVQTNSNEIVPPTTATQIKLADIWKAALKRDQVSIDGQFFDIGGHSLLALEVILEIDSIFGVRFSPQDMWVNTLEQLAARIDVALGNNQTDIQADIHGQPAAIPADQVLEPTTVAGKKPKGFLSRLFGGN